MPRPVDVKGMTPSYIIVRCQNNENKRAKSSQRNKTGHIQRNIEETDSTDLLNSYAGSRGKKRNVFTTSKKNSVPVKLSIKYEGRTFSNIQGFKLFTSHVPFLRKPLENVFHQNEKSKSKREKSQEFEDMSFQHKKINLYNIPHYWNEWESM